MMLAFKVYKINLVRDLREREKKAEKRRRLMGLVGIACFACLALSITYSTLTIWKMESILAVEQKKLTDLQNEYRKHRAAKMVVEKSDVELLHSLQGRGIFWTKKLAALANHLPDNYAITKFGYGEGELRVVGYGTVSPKQDQLLILDEYLNALRRDTTFSGVFKFLYLNKAERKDENGVGRVNFEFSALTKEVKKKP